MAQFQLFQFAIEHKRTYDGECPFYCSCSGGYNVTYLISHLTSYLKMLMSGIPHSQIMMSEKLEPIGSHSVYEKDMAEDGGYRSCSPRNDANSRTSSPGSVSLLQRKKSLGDIKDSALERPECAKV
ncbi:hypothetical protein QQ045_018337 [Rhodiola kirilowii]